MSFNYPCGRASPPTIFMIFRTVDKAVKGYICLPGGVIVMYFRPEYMISALPTQTRFAPFALMFHVKHSYL